MARPSTLMLLHGRFSEPLRAALVFGFSFLELSGPSRWGRRHLVAGLLFRFKKQITDFEKHRHIVLSSFEQ